MESMDLCPLTATHIDLQVLEGGVNMASPSLSQELDMNKGAPMTSHQNTGNNFEENKALKRKLELFNSREAGLRDELEFAPFLSLKKLRMEVANWLAGVEKLRNDFHSIEVASKDCLPPHQQVDILMREAKDVMRQGKFSKRLSEARETKLLEEKMVGETFRRNTTRILEYLAGNQAS